MKRKDLLVADLIAQQRMRQVLQKHEFNFMPLQQMMEQQNATIRNPQPNTQPQQTPPPAVPPSQQQ